MTVLITSVFGIVSPRASISLSLFACMPWRLNSLLRPGFRVWCVFWSWCASGAYFLMLSVCKLSSSPACFPKLSSHRHPPPSPDGSMISIFRHAMLTVPRGREWTPCITTIQQKWSMPSITSSSPSAHQTPFWTAQHRRYGSRQVITLAGVMWFLWCIQEPSSLTSISDFSTLDLPLHYKIALNNIFRWFCFQVARERKKWQMIIKKLNIYV